MMSNSSIMKYIMIIGIFIKLVYTANTTLQLVNVVFRNGDQTPTPGSLYPNDPNKEDSFDPPGLGKLTKSGKTRACDLGRFLRDEYGDFLGDDYVKGIIYARSTNTNRSRESLKLVLEKLYPGEAIPITYKSAIQDVLLLPQPCIGYLVEYWLATQKQDVKDEMSTLEEFKEKLSKWTGKSIKTAFDMFSLYRTLEAESYMNLTMPSWTQDVFPEGDLLKGYLLQAKIQAYDDAIKSRNGGFLIRQFIKAMKSVRKGKMDKKLMLYSAHELNIMAVLQALGVYYPHAPKFSSAVIVELHLIEEAYYVKIKYYKGIPSDLMELRIPGCEDMCPLDQFTSLLKNVMPPKLSLLCEVTRGGVGYFLNILTYPFRKISEMF